ncbi:poly-beta-hydroxybutyrate polymerase N-terminal domain-containing protein [Massilia sp. W12]|uniref:PHA/PHB synthase family protein n=1 Tax=Massilia sp. W12 TaxID=3126507 RepID=UPI0030CD6A0F
MNSISAEFISAAPEQSPTVKLDRSLHAFVAAFTAGLEPVALTLAGMDWGLHLASSPGRQMELGLDAMRKMQNWLQHAPTSAAALKSTESWGEECEQFWLFWQSWLQEATKVRGVSNHHQEMNRFFLRQAFDMWSPRNLPWCNPDIWRRALESGGASLWQGKQNWLEDLQKPAYDPQQSDWRPGAEVAVTPGAVVYRNHLIELIRYSPQTAQVYAEPLLIVPSWIMKYYILDLSPQNSMVRYMLQQGHQVYILSWNNPDAADRDLGMDDYLQMGVFAALEVIASIEPGVAVHSAGYCLGGTLLSIAAAALARTQQVQDASRMAPLASVTLLAAQTDFSEPGEMGVLIDDSQVDMLEDVMSESGYLSGAQMAGAFQFLNSRDLVWNKRVREYWLGVRDAGNDMMAWNADVTRLPARMHGEYLHQFFLENALAEGKYQVEGAPVSLSDIRLPMFVVGTVRDQVSPWPSVYKIVRLTRTDVCFLLASGGHNVGIVAAPGNPKSSYQIHMHLEQDKAVATEAWRSQAESKAGSWWPAWSAWLAAHSSGQKKPRRLPARRVLQQAPGSYVFKT